MKLEACGTDPIADTIQLISTLHSEIDSVLTFKTKWTLINSKLHDIRSQLAEFADLRSANPLAADLVAALSESLADAVNLARKCRSLAPADGKLRTQSEIDSVAARLDRAAKDGEILLRSGILTAAAAVSSRETARAESRSLVTRLQIGPPESRSSAMDALLALLGEDDKSVMIAVAQGAVPAIVRALDSPVSSPEMKEKAVAAIARVSVVESSKHVLIAEGLSLLNHLLRVLDSGSGFSKEKACTALQALTFSRENARSIGSRGGISSLLEICHSGTPGSQASAAGVLRNLAAFAEIRENFVEENGVFVLLALASSGTLLAQENSMFCLCNLVSDDESLKLILVREGAIEYLSNFFDSCPPARSLEPAVELVRQLGSLAPLAEELFSSGFVPRITAALSCGALKVRVSAAGAIHELCDALGSRARKEIGESGCIGALIKMLDGKAAEEKAAAARALLDLMTVASNRRIFRRDEKGVVGLVQMLDLGVVGAEKKHAVAVLAAVAGSAKCRKEIVAAGAGPHLRRLAEMEVDGAKRLLESLGHGKIWGVFRRA